MKKADSILSSDISIPCQPVETARAYGTPETASRDGKLAYLPVALLGWAMGLTGISSAWRLAHVIYGVPSWFAQLIGGLAVLVFALMPAGYAIKTATGFSTVRAEFQHPIAGIIFGTVFISLLLIPIPISDYSLTLTRGIWVAGTVGMVVFAWIIISRLISRRQQAGYATPAWFLPVVALINVPLADPILGMQGQEDLLIFTMGVGLFFAILLFTLIISRLMFDDPLIPSLQPSLMIVVAPFAVGFSAYVNVIGEIDKFATTLYMLAIFLLTVMIARLRFLAVNYPFRFSWWSVSILLAAATVFSLRYAQDNPNIFTNAVALFLLISVSFILVAMLIRTIANLGTLRLLLN